MSQPPSQELAKKLLAFKYTLGENGEPQDDGNPLMKGRWLDAMEQYVSTNDDDLLSLVYDGILLTKDITICSTLEHASDIIHGYHESRPWSDPAPLLYVRTPAIVAHKIAVSGGVPLADFTMLNLKKKIMICSGLSTPSQRPLAWLMLGRLPVSSL